MVNTTRDTFIKNNIGLVHKIANRFRQRGIEYDDLFQAGCVGLIKAVDNFDENRGFQFSTYAVPVIMGEIKHLFRDGGAIKVSRSLREQSMRVQNAREEFLQSHQREPSVSELAAYCMLTEESIGDALQIAGPILSLSATEEENGEEWDIPCDDTEALFDKLTLKLLLKNLTPQEQALIHYRYYQGKTQCETATLLGISQVQVSRREKGILQKLKYEIMKS